MTTLELRTTLKSRQGNAPTLPPSPDLRSALQSLLAFQQSVLEELTALEEIRQGEAAWNQEIRTGTAHYDPEIAAALVAFYRDWVEQGRLRLSQFAQLEAIGFHLQAEQSLRQALDEVKDRLEEASWAELGRRARRDLDEE